MLGRKMTGKLRIAYGRKPYSDGVPVVVRVRESRTHGEGGQVDLMTARGGTRHARR